MPHDLDPGVPGGRSKASICNIYVCICICHNNHNNINHEKRSKIPTTGWVESNSKVLPRSRGQPRPLAVFEFATRPLT